MIESGFRVVMEDNVSLSYGGDQDWFEYDSVIEQITAGWGSTIMEIK